jgi:hypothetical protein
MAIKDIDLDKLKKIASDVKPDSRKRIVLRRVQIQKGIRYNIFTNDIGQIVLDPQVTVPASEVWLFNNPEALASVRRGLLESAQGKISKIDLDTL